MKTLFGLVLMAVLAAACVYYYVTRIAVEPPPSYRTATIKRGEIWSTISATGTLEPEEVVDVGAQVAGMISSLGVDEQRSKGGEKKSIDYGSVVSEGTVLAHIDDALFKAQVDQAEAALKRAKADLGQMQAKLVQAANDVKRAKSLIADHSIADVDYDTSIANYEIAKANMGVDEAAIVQAEAALAQAQTNWSYTTIKSPVQGVIIDRRVDVGQTVVASLNAPSLFLIAKDLRRMQVWASVNEADIGRIQPGMSVRFNVDAYPRDTFRGTVSQIRLNATMTQNVVTYTVVVDTDNSNLLLKPYLTANVQFEVDHRSDALLVPNAALRFKPKTQQILPEYRAAYAASLAGKTDDKPAGNGKHKDGDKPADNAPVAKDAPAKDNTAAADTTAPAKPADNKPTADKTAGKDGAGKTAGKPHSGQGHRRSKDREDRGRVWVVEGDFLRPIDVQVGLNDGSQTEVSSAELKENQEVVIGVAVAADTSGGDNNPFAPKLFNRSGGSGSSGSGSSGGGSSGGGSKGR